MKNIFKTTVLCLGVLSLTACNDWLDTSSPSLAEEDLVFSSEEMTADAVTGIYAKLCADPYAQLMTIHQGTGTDVELIDGIGATATGQNSERDGMNYNATTSWAKLGTLWEKQFETIEACNRVIDGISNSSIAENDKMMELSAEARVIRAMVYLDVIRVWGDVPMMLHGAQADLSNVNVGKTDRDVILDALIEDLENVVAENKLPWCGQVSSEHINMGYAKGLLANLYMTRAGYAIREDSNDKAVAGGYSSQQKLDAGYQKASYTDDVFMTLCPSQEDRIALYKKAKQQLEDIINSGRHQMNPSFANEWELINKLELDQTYYENIFEIPFGFGNAGELGYTVGVRMNGNTADWGNYNSSGKMKTTAVQLYSYQPTDTRRDITCVNFEIKDLDRSATQSAREKEQYSGGKDVVTYEARLSNKPFGLYIGKWDIRKMSDRWKQQNFTASSKFGYGINVVRMRYPQILLWYAECIAFLAENAGEGSVADAAEYVKQVHNRAFSDAVEAYQGSTPEGDKEAFAAKVDAATSYEAMLDIIDLENRLEFCGENFRKWDLIRWNRLHDDIWKAKTEYNRLKSSGIFVTKIYYKYLDDAEKYIDASSITWYGENGTNETSGTDIAAGGSTDYSWLDQMGYHTTKDDYNPGKGKDYKGLNGDSYNTSAFGTDYANYDTEMPSIAGGLVGTQKNCNYGRRCEDEGITVKNRYLMPIYSNVVNSSIGSDKKPRVYNSYGY
ncbi:MAG: RagB/SusD family nutrient uptake outer membrane protein [Prevotella sp.]|nr:RagB/SusD family nutrient uptake outer membrane protein [Prevotella sp.]